MKPVTFAVVGCGNIGSGHLALLDAQPHTTLVGLCDIDAAGREKYGALYEDVPVYASIEDRWPRL